MCSGRRQQSAMDDGDDEGVSQATIDDDEKLRVSSASKGSELVRRRPVLEFTCR